MRIATSLRDHCTYNTEAQRKQHYFSHLITKLSELRTVASYGHRRILERVAGLRLYQQQQQQQQVLTNSSKGSAAVAMSSVCALQRKLGDDEELPQQKQQQQQQQQQQVEMMDTSSSAEGSLSLPSISSMYPAVFPSWPPK